MAELRQQPCVSLGCCKSHTGWVLLSIRNPFCTVLEADSLSGCRRGQVLLRAPLLTAASLYTPFWARDMLESLWRKCAWILFLRLCPHCFLTIHRQCHHLGDEDFHIWILSAQTLSPLQVPSAKAVENFTHMWPEVVWAFLLPQRNLVITLHAKKKKKKPSGS